MKKLKIGRRRNGGFIDLGAAMILAAGALWFAACGYVAENGFPPAKAPDGWSMMAR